MKEHQSKALRTLLKANPDGLTVTALADMLSITPDGVRKSLKHMPDSYIAEWVQASNGRFMSVWRVVVPPADAPNPEVSRGRLPFSSKYAPRQPAAPRAAPAPIQHAPQGLTQIRGPWPSFH